MNIVKRIATLSVVIVTVLTLVGCGGGSGSAPPPDDNNGGNTGGITRSGIAAGPISNFGSIIVNGVTYNTDTAVFVIDDAPGTEADLSVGQFVVVKGELEDDLINGTATEVLFDDNVEGPVQAIDRTGNALTVLGQVVRIGSSTSFDDTINPPSIDGFAVDDIVEISGLVAADGSIDATRIELKPAGTEFEVHGLVENLDSTATTFSLASLTVNFTNAMLEDFPGGQISEGDFVEAKGNGLNILGELAATVVEFESSVIDGDDGDRVELEGLITRFQSATDFDVAGVPVTTNAATEFEGGSATDLALNVKVEVEGDFQSGGEILASKVDIRRSKSVRITALADSVDSTNSSLVLLGITVNVDALTRLEDKSAADESPLTLALVMPGDYLEIRGTESPAGSAQVLAAIVEREDPETESQLQGFVTSVGSASFIVLGVTIDTTPTTTFRDADGLPLGASEFFNQLAVDSLVKAQGLESSATAITAEEVEFEVED